MTDLGTLGGDFSRASAINPRGQVVGDLFIFDPEGSDEDPPEFQAFLWEKGVRTDLGTLGGTDSRALGINPRGQVVGVSRTASGVEHAFLWEKGVMTDLGTLGGGFSQANAINSASQVVGFSTTASGEFRATLWTRKSALGAASATGSAAHPPPTHPR
jgi:probable HAF family extracellular repeat protein